MAGEWDAFPVVSGPSGADNWDAFPKVAQSQPIDFSQPVATVRKAIAALPEGERQAALDQWAKTYVAKERSEGGIGQTIDNTVRTLSRGTFVGPFLDEITAGSNAALNAVTGGAVGAPYDETLAYQRAKDQAFDAANPATSVVGQIAGGLAGGIGAARTVGATGATNAARFAAGGPFAAIKGTDSALANLGRFGGAGAVYGGVGGFGNAQGGLDERLEGAAVGGAIGAGAGALLPPLISGATKVVSSVSDAVTPQVARVAQGVRNLTGGAADDVRPQSVGAARAPREELPPITGAQAAADQVIANQLSRAGVSTTDLRQRLAQSRIASELDDTGARLPNAIAPVDLDPSLQKLAGSAARQQPEAGNRARSFVYGRQTGMTPIEGMPDGTGIPTRRMMAQPDADAPAMGQGERVRVALRRAFDVPDGTPYQNEQRMIEAARQRARATYTPAYQAAEGVDIRPAIEPVLAQWQAQAAQAPTEIAGAIRRAIRNYQTQQGTVSSLRDFQAAKEVLDARVTKLMEGLDSAANRRLGTMLADMQRQIRSAVDGIETNGVGRLYQAARQQFSDDAAMRNAYRLGQGAVADGAEVTAAQYRALPPGEQQMFRMGLLSKIENDIGRSKRTADITQAFETPNMQEILMEIVPQGRMPDRAQRLGGMIDTEKSFIRTRNEVLGNSKTAERTADDEAFNNMTGLVEQLRTSRRVSDIALKATQKVLDSMFGFRADTADAIARRLFTADRREIERLLLNLEVRMGPDRAAQFRRVMATQYGKIARAAGITGAQPRDPNSQ